MCSVQTVSSTFLNQVFIYPLIALSTLGQDAVYAKLITHNIELCAQELAENFHASKSKQSSEKSYTRYLKIR